MIKSSQSAGIIRRSLSHSEAMRLHQELKSTPNILGYTVRELERLTDVQVAQVGEDLAGACWSIDLTQGWTEIAGLYVLPAFRGNGIGEQLFRAAWDRTLQRERHVYVISRNPQVVVWMRELGLAVDKNLWRAPFAVHWYMQWYMMSWLRVGESIRKSRQIARCPRMMQGIKRYIEIAPS